MFEIPNIPKKADQASKMNAQIPLKSIQEIAKTRWFRTTEIYYILTNMASLSTLGLQISPNVELHTPSSIFSYISNFLKVALFSYSRCKNQNVNGKKMVTIGLKEKILRMYVKMLKNCAIVGNQYFD